MICIAKNNLGVDVIAQFTEMHSLDTAHRADGHEDRGRYLPVVCRNQSGAGRAARSHSFYLEFHILCKVSKFPPIYHDRSDKGETPSVYQTLSVTDKESGRGD